MKGDLRSEPPYCALKFVLHHSIGAFDNLLAAHVLMLVVVVYHISQHVVLTFPSVELSIASHNVIVLVYQINSQLVLASHHNIFFCRAIYQSRLCYEEETDFGQKTTRSV